MSPDQALNCISLKNIPARTQNNVRAGKTSDGDFGFVKRSTVFLKFYLTCLLGLKQFFSKIKFKNSPFSLSFLYSSVPLSSVIQAVFYAF